MMHVNFNRSTSIVLISLSLALAGCTETAQKPINLSDQLPGGDEAQEQDGYYQGYSSAKNRLKFGKRSSSSQHATVWDRLLSLYSLPVVDHYRVDKAVDWYLQHPATLAIIQQRAEPYLHHILDEVEAKNIPGEIALLPVVESAFQANAYSHADASGLWQFIPSTGEEYGLEQNAWYDGRRDVYASTKAATTYLKELSENFDGDWLLALASYNCGKNKVRRSIEHNENRNLPTDYWSLNLPQETEDYVPRLLAIAKIFANAEQYNINLRHIPNKPYFEVVDIDSPLDLRLAAQLANTPYDKFLKLNPGFNKACTAPYGPHRLLVPVEHAQAFKRNLAQVPLSERVDYAQLQRVSEPVAKRVEAKKPEIPHKPEPRAIVEVAHNTRYQVKPGETLSTIASRQHTTIASLRDVNHLRTNSVRSGTYLQVPNTAKSTFAKKTESLPKLAKVQTTGNQVYTVKKGDTVWNISQRFAVSPKELAEWNKLNPKTGLISGRKLTIKPFNPQIASASPSIRLMHYTVGKGDTLTQIARKFNVSVTDLQKSNRAVLGKGLQSGQKLKILVDGRPST